MLIEPCIPAPPTHAYNKELFMRDLLATVADIT